MASKGIVISLFDFTGVAVRPWAEAGYTCLCFDLQHTRDVLGRARGERVGKGSIHFIPWDSDVPQAAHTVTQAVSNIRWLMSAPTLPVVMVYGFPVCTDLAASGALHWKRRLEADPHCQTRAVNRAKLCASIGDHYSAPYAIENPQGALGRLWRKHDHSFNPCDFGGYLPADDAHPLWPEYIAPRDAYKKRTLIWSGNGYRFPAKNGVEPEVIKVGNKSGSRQWARLGGKSTKTKNIRSATPRGFALASFLANTAPRPSRVERALSRFGLSLSA